MYDVEMLDGCVCVRARVRHGVMIHAECSYLYYLISDGSKTHPFFWRLKLGVLLSYFS